MKTHKIESRKSATKDAIKNYSGISNYGFGTGNNSLKTYIQSKDGGGCCCCCCCCCCSTGAADISTK